MKIQFQKNFWSTILVFTLIISILKKSYIEISQESSFKGQGGINNKANLQQAMEEFQQQ